MYMYVYMFLYNMCAIIYKYVYTHRCSDYYITSL